jgi:hypothetical protein
MDAEAKWFRRLMRVFDDMPHSVEVSVHNGGHIAMHEVGSRDKYFDAHGDLDNVPEMSSFACRRVFPCGEST